MSMFTNTNTNTKTKTDQVVVVDQDGNPANPDLPTGYDDPASDFYVLPEYRPFYRPDPTGEQKETAVGARALLRWVGERNALALYDKLSAGGARDDARRLIYPPDRSNHAKYQILERNGYLKYDRNLGPAEPTAAETALYIHLRRREAAKRACANQEIADQAAAIRLAQMTCEMCGTVDPRLLTRGLATIDGKQVQACAECQVVAEHELAGRAAAATVNGRTRGEAVAAWIETNRS